jgi:hypothetical protein
MPVSQLLFNPCLEPLFERIEIDVNIQGTYVRTKEESFVKITVQAYPDDAVFVSEKRSRSGRIFKYKMGK